LCNYSNCSLCHHRRAYNKLVGLWRVYCVSVQDADRSPAGGTLISDDSECVFKPCLWRSYTNSILDECGICGFIGPDDHVFVLDHYRSRPEDYCRAKEFGKCAIAKSTYWHHSGWFDRCGVLSTYRLSLFLHRIV